MSLIQGSGAAEVVAVLQSSQIQGYCTVAASTFVFYDHISTVAREAAFIWGRKCSSVTVLFHLNRWTIFIWAALGLFNFISLTTASSCTGLALFNSVTNLLIFIIWAAFSAIRTYAVGGSKWGVALLVFLLNMVPVGTNAWNFFVITSAEIVAFPFIGTICTDVDNISATELTRFAIATRVCTIAADIVILLVTWSKTYALNRGDATKYGLRSSLGTTLLRDGTLYFVVLLFLNVLNIVGIVTNFFNFTISTFATPLSSVIITHFLLNLRQAASDSNDSSASSSSFVRSQASTLRFVSFIGNMGEPLDHGSVSSNLGETWSDEGDTESGDEVYYDSESESVA